MKLFLPEEAEFIDRYRQNIVERKGLGEIAFNRDCKTLYALYAMIKHINDTCFVGGRYYNGQTLAKVEHRIGHQRNQGRNLIQTFQETIEKLWFPTIPQPKHEHVIYNQDIMQVLKQPNIKSDLLYLDPPYGGASSDYIALYRFLEEFIHQKSYTEMDYLRESGDRFNDDKGYTEQFRNLLKECERFPNWLISFNATSFATLDEIVGVIKEFRKDVVVKGVKFSYKYRKDRSKPTDCEYIILARS